MTRGLRRLKNLNIDGDGAEVAQEEHENVADNENNESLQSPPDVDGLLVRLPHQPRSPIKIIFTDLPSDPILHNMRTRRVQAASMGISESRQKQVYLISLINKGRVVAKGKLVTTDSQREILGAKLGPEYCGVLVEGLENIELGNNIGEEVPRPSNQIRTLIDVIGYVIPWPITHVKQARSSSCTRNKLVPAARGQS
ncbi:uncharacterized protein [Zea mays]|uniref:uncharacterized protein n=1 Tax=Zea mays TaxID=4577 RepID=UPI0009A9A62A|nr:uncharacterized protein LOC103627076 [Zea mays]|eukprot:XP_008645629.2 uncharacterized protein LOC103627076 [Zea mays]